MASATISPQANQAISRLISDNQGQISTFPFTPNVAAEIPASMRQRIYRWMLTNYIWPQIQERQAYEKQWDKLLDMARAALRYESRLIGSEDTRLARKRELDATDRKIDGVTDIELSERIEISDTLIFDAIDRLTNLNHFIGFKESLPVRFERPEDMVYPMENQWYSPSKDLVKSANCWLKFNAAQANMYRKGWMTARHHYTYGISIVDSQYMHKIGVVKRRVPGNPKAFQDVPELENIGITFEPMSLRKVWLNARIPIYEMDYQVCPFYFNEVPRFAIIANQYNPDTNPFGYVNQATLGKAQYLYSDEALHATYTAWQTSQNVSVPLTSLLKPEYNIELLWTLYPMLPIGIDETMDDDPENPGKFVFDDDGTKGIIPTRWICQMFGNNITSGQMEIVRLQRNFYPRDQLPLYGSAHMPSLDDGVYSMAIGTVLENHYMQICKAILQYLENKDWVNDPSATVLVNSPGMEHDLNRKGKKVPVLTQNDIKHREMYDATGTTPAFIDMVRTQGQTSSKAVDAILGKAMGSRTSATEAGNIFQTAMSGVTTDINLFAHDIYGTWANRVWEYTGYWVDPDILCEITGSYGFAIKPEHLSFRLGLKVDVGSSFVESLVRQQNYRWILQAVPPGDPTINRALILKELLKEQKIPNVDQIVNDGGLEQQILLANEQATSTYLGNFVLIDPDQDHNIAIRVKKSYLANRYSVWNTNPQYARNGVLLVGQMEQHMRFLQMQLLQQQLMMEQQRLMQSSQVEDEANATAQAKARANPPRLNTSQGQERQAQGT